MKKLIALALIVCFALGFAGCGGKGVLVMGTNAEFDPFEYVNSSGEIDGFDVALANEIAKELGMTLKIENMDFDLLIGALSTGKIDIILAGMTATDERRLSVDFTKAYFNASQVIIVAADNNAVAGPDDLAGLKVGVQLGTTGDEAVTSMGGIEVVRYANGAAAAVDLVNGKISAIVIDYYPAKVIVDGSAAKLKMIDNKFTEEEYAAAVKKGSDLLGKVDAAIDKIKADGRYDEIYKNYIPE